MTLSTLDIKYFKKQSIVYFVFSILCFAFGRIYEIFSHDVYSKFMMNAFLIPLFMGCLLSLIIYLLKIKKLANRLSVNLYNAGVATLTVYSIFRGVLEIYGTTNYLINIYLCISISMFLISIVALFKKIIKTNIYTFKN